MRITVIAVGSKGVVYPRVALGLGLQAAGHDVLLASNAAHEPFVRSQGLAFWPVIGVPPRLILGDIGPEMVEPARGARAIARLALHRAAERAGPALWQHVRDCWHACQDAEAIVGSLNGLFAGHAIAEKLGVPAVAAFTYPIHPTGDYPSPFFPLPLPLGRAYNHATHRLARHIFWQLCRPALNAARREVLQLPPLPGAGSAPPLTQRGAPVLYGFSPTVVPRPADWEAELQVTGYWFPAPAPGWQPPARLTDFLAAGPPPVYVGFGMVGWSTPRRGAALTAVALRALARTRLRAVVLAGADPEEGVRLPSDQVLLVEEVPHAWLFPRVAAVVYHGGSGTTGAALRAGRPAVVLPVLADQPFWAQRVYALGVGPRPIPPAQLSAARLAAALIAATEDVGMRARAAALGARIGAEDGVGRAVAAIEQYLGVRRDAARRPGR